MPYKDKKTKLLKMKLLYDERKLKGLCVACGEKNDTPERVYCSWCSEKRVLARKRYKNGGCGHHDCTTCPYPYCKASQKEIDRRERKAHENSKKSWSETNQRWKEAGLCFRCGKEIEEGLKSVCRSCQNKQNKNKRKYYRKNHVDKYHEIQFS